MKEKLKLTLLLAVSSLSISGCTFYEYIINYGSSSHQEYSGDTLKYTFNDYLDNCYYDYDCLPTTGSQNILVLPILFKDSNNILSEEEKVKTLENVQAAFFGTTRETGWNSVKTYYEAESHGTLSLNGIVADWYQSDKEYSYFTDSRRSGLTSTDKIESLITEALESWKENNPTLISSYDQDNDGYIDAVAAIYGGPNNKNAVKYRLPALDAMWAYTTYTDNKAVKNNPTLKTYMWASYDFMSRDNAHGLTIDTHTYIHETGHIFGLDDYYDYNDQNYVWAGGYSMQDYNVGGHDPYSALLFGWANPKVAKLNDSISIRPFESTGDLIIVSPDWQGSQFDEYLIIELYTPTGVNERDSKYQYYNEYPTGLTSYGVRLWHVDSRLVTNLSLISNYNYRGTVTNEITKGKEYVIGCTNSSSYGDLSRCSKLAELREFRQLDLIRRNDYTFDRCVEQVANEDLFKTGDTFFLPNYTGYFQRSAMTSLITRTPTFNNGKAYKYTINFTNVSANNATITITNEQQQ